VDALAERAVEPAAWIAVHHRRGRGPAQLLRDLPWIRISVPYWSDRLGAVLGERVLDEAQARRVIGNLAGAFTACERLDLRTTGIERARLRVDLTAALIRRDEAALVAALRACAERRDRRSDELVTGTLVEVARHLPPGWFRRVLALWDEHAATRPGYFAIAWGCAAAGAVPQALEASVFAAHRLADEPEAVAEAAYLQRVLAGGDEP
jgi:hypothetical protein